MKARTFFLVAALGVSLAACQSNSNDEPPIGELPPAQSIQLTLAEKVASDNTFALDLLRTTCRYAEPADNVFISPLSVSMALNMTVNGAQGTTKDEMLTALRAQGYSMDDINEYSRSLRSALIAVDPLTELAIANSIWYRNGFSVKTPFIDVNRTNYDAEVREIDFSSPDAVTQINGWCARNTKDKIPEIITEIRDDVVMYLINAVYFKGIWVYQFDKKDTKEENFYLPDGTTSKVNMMRQQATLNYTADEDAAYLELPYGNRAFSMIVILPQDGKTPDEVAAQLDSERWDSRMEELSEREINLRLPRFKTECKYFMQNDILPDMGMVIPFTPRADFSGISDRATYISAVIHKTYVDVNEEGTEAAAVTAVEMATYSAGPSSPLPFIVNKPFLFAIREQSTGVILFMGKMETL